MNPLIERLKKTSAVGVTSGLMSESSMFDVKDAVQTDIPALNIALGASLQGGIVPGLTFIAGPSRTFKTNMSLKLVEGYLNKYPESVCIFYNSEFGVTKEYLKDCGVDPERVWQVEIKDIEELTFDCMKKLQEFKKGDKVIFLIDSIGNLASKKEVDDALDEKSVADMTRAKKLKGLFRMITPHLATKDLSMIAINHTYSTMELYAKQIMGGGTGPMYSANLVWFISRAQDKDGKELEGYTFTINIEKSRFHKEKSKIPLTVTFEDGIQKYSGLFDLALEAGFIKQSGAWYEIKNLKDYTEFETKKYRKDDIDGTFFDGLLLNKEFNTYIEKTYQL